jgi:hypothetical protein
MKITSGVGLRVNITLAKAAMTVLYTEACIWIRTKPSIGVLALLDIKNGEQRCNNDEQCRIDEVSPRTDSFSKAECCYQNWIITQASVCVEEPFWFERIWVWINGWVM